MCKKCAKCRVKILLSTFRVRLIIYTIFGENQIFRIMRQKRRDMRIVKCQVNNKVTHLFSARQNRKGAVTGEGFLTDSPPACLSLYFPSYQSTSYRLVSTRNQGLAPANSALFPDGSSYFHRSLHTIV